MVSMPMITSIILSSEVLEDHPVGLVRTDVVQGAVEVGQHHHPLSVSPQVEIKRPKMGQIAVLSYQNLTT